MHTPHIMLGCCRCRISYFLPFERFEIGKPKEKFFSGIFNKECDRQKFMLERIIKNNYRNGKNMFFSAAQTDAPNICDRLKHCAVPLQSTIYDINYRTFLPLLKRFFSHRRLPSSLTLAPDVALIRCNGKWHHGIYDAWFIYLRFNWILRAGMWDSWKLLLAIKYSVRSLCGKQES